MLGNGATWGLCAASTAAVITRPFGWPEAIWAVLGAALLLLFGLMPPSAALSAVGKGMDVYLFLLGMMLLSETARAHGLFDWVAATAAMHARGSTSRLFLLVYITGIVTTTFLSNDATAVVLTPAVFRLANHDPAAPSTSTTSSSRAVAVSIARYASLTVSSVKGRGSSAGASTPASASRVASATISPWCSRPSPVRSGSSVKIPE